MEETRKITLKNYADIAMVVDCPVAEGYVYTLLVLSGDQILTVYNQEGQVVEYFDSDYEDARIQGYFDGLEIFTSFEKLEEYLNS